ncbi:MAG: leucine-rich repeat domain-containing protein [Eubacterium sp.]|nr:leucine-rich repeat domain-containing protein [Eubacterium sp.]
MLKQNKNVAYLFKSGLLGTAVALAVGGILNGGLSAMVSICSFNSNQKTYGYISQVYAAEASENSTPDGIYRSQDGCWYYAFRTDLLGVNGVYNDGSIDSDEIVITGHSIDENAPFTTETYMEGEEEKTRFVIPSSIDGYRVTAIGYPVNNCYYNPLTEPDKFKPFECGIQNIDTYDEVIIPRGIDTIYQKCFYNSGFKSIVIPEGVKYIGESAFFYDINLENITFPRSIEYIGERAFRKTAWLENMRIRSTQHLVMINDILIDGIAAAGNVSIPQHITKIAGWAFYGNGTSDDDAPSQLSSVTIPDSVVEIGDYAFAECRNLNSVSIGTGLEKMGQLCFSRSGIEEIVLPKKLTEAGAGICYQCKSLKKVTVGTGLIELPYASFQSCTALESISLPETLIAINPQCFWGCSSLKEISIPKNVEYIGKVAFKNCVSLTKIILPEKLEEIGNDAFMTNADSEKIVLTVPEAMTDISGFGFLEMDYITFRVLAGGAVQKYLDENEVPTYQTYMKGMQDIYEGTVNITNNNITNNTTNNNITNIDNSVTNNITNNNTTTNNKTDNSNTNIINNNNSNNKTDNSKHIVKGAGEEHIAGISFTYKNMKYEINDDEISVTLVGPAKSKRNKIKKLAIPATVKYGKTKLKVTKVDDNACKEMKNLKTVVIGKNVEVIGNKSFASCKNLTKVLTDKGLNEIGDRAFINCTSLKNVTLGKNVEKIGIKAFYGDKKIKVITFKNLKKLKNVGKAAFDLRSKKTVNELKKDIEWQKDLKKYLMDSGVIVNTK